MMNELAGSQQQSQVWTIKGLGADGPFPELKEKLMLFGPVRGRLGNGRSLSTARRNRDQSQGRDPLRLDSKRKGRSGRLDEQGSADRKSDPIRDDYPIL